MQHTDGTPCAGKDCAWRDSGGHHLLLQDIRIHQDPDGAIIVTWPQDQERDAAILQRNSPISLALGNLLRSIRDGAR